MLLTVGGSAHAAPQNDTVARGHALAILGDCEGCHESPTHAPFAGGQGFTAAYGTVYSSNISSDPTYGIGRWTADDFYRAMKHGVRADGGHLYPAFPYSYFTHMRRADSDALYAYMRTVKPVHTPAPKNDLIFPFSIRTMMVFWNMLFLHDAEWQPDPAKSAQWNRGSYIVNGLCHCGACHTPKNILFGDSGAPFSGGVQQGWFAANLTGTKPDGLGEWTAAEVAQYLKTGVTDHATAVGPMQEVVAKSTSRMSDADRAAIATYLKSLAPQKLQTFTPPSQDTMEAGRAVFVAHCMICHRSDRREENGGYPLLPRNTIVQGRDPSTVIQVILNGSQSIALSDKQTSSYSMPSFATLSDAEVASAATYIRNSWGNRGSTVTPETVKKLRHPNDDRGRR
jgi:mono/diheme cytochrome c family protein